MFYCDCFQRVRLCSSELRCDFFGCMSRHDWFVAAAEQMRLVGERLQSPVVPNQRPGPGPIGRTRILSRVTTQKDPRRSGWASTSAKARSAASSGDSGVMRNSTTPLPAESPRRKTSSPKSLSNARRIPCCSAQRAATSSSEMPGRSSAIENTSQPAFRSASRAGRGKFSSARNLMRS